MVPDLVAWLLTIGTVGLLSSDASELDTDCVGGESVVGGWRVNDVDFLCERLVAAGTLLKLSFSLNLEGRNTL